jgi:ubiquinone/menaquinone biosynthesis C-methylase UbiE
MVEKELLAREEAFHDDWANSIDIKKIKVDDYFEVATAPENRYIIKNLGSVKGKTILELGCGAGEASVYFAKQGAIVTATDLSQGMLDVTMRLAAIHGTQVSTVKTPAAPLPFPDNSFDIIYAANVLHHVDLEITLQECKRVLKPGGRFCSWDPLAHNPVINVYRRMAMGVRTKDEHPIKMKQLKYFKNTFKTIDIHTTWLFGLWIFLRFYFLEKIDPNKERYWKKIIDEHQRLDKLYNRLENYDRRLLRILPFLKRYCWNITVLATK